MQNAELRDSSTTPSTTLRMAAQGDNTLIPDSHPPIPYFRDIL
jgi:hypothetical protein